MKTNDIRARFLEFYKERGHTIVPSASLVPADDPTILFTTAGMAQFKDLFMGLGAKPYPRATSVQKCLRAGDLDNVGRTPRHHTFFEMLGNFSFGDYFKKQAIPWTWEMYTQAVGFDPKQLWISVFRDDDEAFDIWKDEVGVPAHRIKRFDEKDNFWPGHPRDIDNGPCGPCSEIYYDPDPATTDEKNPDYENKFVEIGNIVFMQFSRGEGGSLAPLPKPNIDFGGGLERIAAARQGVRSNFESDLFVPLVAAIAEKVGHKYVFDSENGVRMRRIADHLRAASFAIHDRALPSNEGRGYVVRKIIRRAVADAKAMGTDKPFLFSLVPVVADMMSFYPSLKDDLKNVTMFIENEEKQFLKTLDQGMKVLGDYVNELKAAGTKQLDGERAFKLYDTYGLPLEEAEAVLQAQGIAVDRDGYAKAMDEQRRRAQAGSKMQGEVFADNYLADVKKNFKPTKFTGYTSAREQSPVLAVAVNEQLADAAGPGTDVILVTDATPFYAESGGQVGDRGTITQGEKGGADYALVEVTDTQSNGGYILHYGTVKEGRLVAGKPAVFQVDEALRLATRKNHTAAHLLHKTLKDVLGSHVSQAGSLVDEHRCRFDFTHPKQVTRDEVREIERRINADIQKAVDVNWYETELEKAKAAGVVAMFGEKYGNIVRVVDVPGLSRELCGGTHIDNIGKIGVFKIVSEGALAAGVRRIEAHTGEAALDTLLRSDAVVADLRGLLAVKEDEVKPRVEKLMTELKDLQRQMAQLQKTALAGQLDEIIAQAPVKDGVKVITHHFENAGADQLKGAMEVIGKLSDPYAACLFASEGPDKVSMAVRLHPDVVKKGLNAGNIVKELAPLIGGKGGGRPDSAQAGGKDVGAISTAIIMAFQKLS